MYHAKSLVHILSSKRWTLKNIENHSAKLME